MSSNSPNGEDHPVMVALKNAQVLRRMEAQAKACLRKYPRVEWEEAVNEATKRALGRPEKWDPSKGDVAIWLLGIVRYVARELARHPPSGLDPPESLIDQSSPVADAIDNKMYIAHLLGELNDSRNIKIVQMWANGHSAKEIGAERSIMMSENTVRVRLSRTLAKLREICGMTEKGQS